MPSPAHARQPDDARAKEEQRGGFRHGRSRIRSDIHREASIRKDWLKASSFHEATVGRAGRDPCPTRQLCAKWVGEKSDLERSSREKRQRPPVRSYDVTQATTGLPDQPDDESGWAEGAPRVSAGDKFSEFRSRPRGDLGEIWAR